MRELNIQQRVTLANTFLTSKLWYIGSVMTISKYHLGRLTFYLGIFIWANGGPRIWRNINNNKLNSKQRSYFYLLVNEKIVTEEIKFKFGMKTNPNCEKCGMIEDIEHKFKECKIIKNIWILFTQIVKDELHIKPNFHELIKPDMNNINKEKRAKVM
uniref:Zf-RVT domain-containing protein n=1 Tax=Anopheles quadriannulatus TaxID=34691 RepID=A0A182WUY5_ANOQN